MARCLNSAPIPQWPQEQVWKAGPCAVFVRRTRYRAVVPVDGPYVNGDQFAVKYSFEITEKKTRKRSSMTEIAVYTVKDAKIVQERFFGHSPER